MGWVSRPVTYNESRFFCYHRISGFLFLIRMKTYSEKLKDPRWQKRRLEILQRDSFTCRLCTDTETELHINHKKYTGEPWDAPSRDLETLCKHCHILTHALAENNIYSVRKVENPDFISIIFNTDLCTGIGHIEKGKFNLTQYFRYNSKSLQFLSELNSFPNNIEVDFSDNLLSYLNFGGEAKLKKDIQYEFNGVAVEVDQEFLITRTDRDSEAIFTITKIENNRIFLAHTGGVS